MSWLRTSIVVCVGVLALSLSGCNEALFPDDAPRSPYTRYSDLRGQTRVKSEKDAYGRPQPALRERLTPLQ